MATKPNQRECPCCHGTDLMDGKIGVYKHTFIPANRFMWLGYPLKAFVCLDCGFVGQYLGNLKIQTLRRHLSVNRSDEPNR